MESKPTLSRGHGGIALDKVVKARAQVCAASKGVSSDSRDAARGEVSHSGWPSFFSSGKVALSGARISSFLAVAVDGELHHREAGKGGEAEIGPPLHAFNAGHTAAELGSGRGKWLRRRKEEVGKEESQAVDATVVSLSRNAEGCQRSARLAVGAMHNRRHAPVQSGTAKDVLLSREPEINCREVDMQRPEAICLDLLRCMHQFALRRALT